jgi:hypothetical protein
MLAACTHTRTAQARNFRVSIFEIKKLGKFFPPSCLKLRHPTSCLNTLACGSKACPEAAKKLAMNFNQIKLNLAREFAAAILIRLISRDSHEKKIDTHKLSGIRKAVRPQTDRFLFSFLLIPATNFHELIGKRARN